MENDDKVYDNFYGFVGLNLSLDQSEIKNVLVFDESDDATSLAGGLFDSKTKIDVNVKTTGMYGYDVVLSRENIVYSDLNKIRSQLNYLYHLLTINGIIGIEFNVPGPSIGKDSLEFVIGDATNLILLNYQEIEQQDVGNKLIRMVLRAA